MKWFFYLYYPLHLVVIGILRLMIYGTYHYYLINKLNDIKDHCLMIVMVFSFNFMSVLLEKTYGNE